MPIAPLTATPADPTATLNEIIAAVNTTTVLLQDLGDAISGLSARIYALATQPTTGAADLAAVRTDLITLTERIATAWETQARGGVVLWER